MANEATARRKLPGSLDANRTLATWLSINKDGTVDMRPGKIEIGQGILTALTQIVADELDVKLERIRVITADTAQSPNEGVTSGSRSIEESGMAFRYAAAEARELLLARAGARLGVSIEQLSVNDGTITSRSGGNLTYWDITDESLLQREATAGTAPKPYTQHQFVGGSAPRADIPRKVSGVPSYVQDLDLPGMLHGRVVRPPSLGAQLISVDLEDVRAMPGVVAVLRDGSYLGVVAAREEQAIRAQRRLARNATWHEVAKLPEFDPRYLLKRNAKTEAFGEKSDPNAAASGATLEAEYSRHFLAHAALAPSCAVAVCNGGKFIVWTHSQNIYPLRGEMAPMLGVPPQDIVIHHAEGAGCYGHNGADDVAADAALLARAVAGSPVRVQWMRDEEFMWEPFGSAMVMKARATLGKDGSVASWHFDIWSHAHSSRPGRGPGSNLLPSWYLEKPLARAQGFDPPLPGGGSHRNGIPLYDFPNQRIANHVVPDPPIRVSTIRGVGSHANVFAIESFMDELAFAANVDPVEYRLRHLKDARARAVIEKVAAMAGWKPNQKGDGTRGKGIGFARYKNTAAYVAIMAEVELVEDLLVPKLWCAFDVGQAIHVDGVINQIEGGIIQAVSFTLKEAVKYDRERVTQQSWEDYPILSFTEVPEVEVALINHPELSPVGAGEGTQGPVSAAIGNALFNAAGVRLRDLPFTRDRLVAAMLE
ncbi:MAG: molybdopterin cofactor-binding domain-containing protein [Burkholderiales bacterium]